MPVPMCEPCLRRNRQSRASRKVGEEWFCNECWMGGGAEERKCRLCPRNIRESNQTEYCAHCQQSGAAKKDIKKREENESVRPSPNVEHESGGFTVPADFK